MNKKFIPFAHAQSIYEIDENFFKVNNVKIVLTDLDNTLDNITVLKPSKEAIDLKAKFDALGIKLIIISNNTSDRVKNYSADLGIEYKSNMRKPFSSKIKKFIKESNFDPSEVMMIGDQIMTDVIAASGAGLRIVLTEPLREPEPPWTKFNRIFERPIKKKLIKNKLLIDWKERL